MKSDDFRAYSARVRPLVEESFMKELSSIFDAPSARVCSSLFPELQAGKKLRGCLTCMIAEALGGRLESAVPRAVAIELIQAATLIHDDFVDQDTTRRNRPALWTLEGSRRAVLIGDVIFASAISMMNDIGREDGRVISKAIAEIARGALSEPLELVNADTRLQSDQACSLYDEIIRLKTGILFASACQLGALTAGREAEVQERLYQFGLRLGEAYQIADDLKEIKECVLAGGAGITRKLAAVVPAVMRFSPEWRPSLLTDSDGQEYDSAIREVLFLAAGCMEDEIERRLAMALHEIDLGAAVDSASADWMRAASRDIIDIFNES